MVINCTPHNINIYTPSGCYMRDGSLYLRDDEEEYPQPYLTLPAAKEPTRVTLAQKVDGMVDGILIYWWAPDEIVNLPEPKPGTYYIVSKMVAQAWPAREDFIFPGTLVHDADGHVVGCIDFSRV